jgi:hypothetical protein
MWINSRARMVGDAGHLRRRKNEGPSAMIATNRDLTAMQELLDREILRLQRIASDGAEPGLLDRRLVALCRQRIAVCAALVNRRIEASNKVVVFSRWVSGNGALGDADTGCNRETMPFGEGRRRQSPL